MNKNRSKIMLTSAIVAALFFTLLGIVLRALALFEAYRPSTGYYDPAAASPSAFAILSLVLLPVLILLALVFRRAFVVPHWTSSIATLFASALLVLTLLVYTVSTLIALPSVADAYVATLTALAAVFAVIFLVYLSASLFGHEPKREGIQAYLPFALALFALLLATALYFDKTTQMNHPPKGVHMIAFIALACYAVCEARHLLGRLKSPLAYVVTSAALFFTGAASVPNVLYSLANNRILVLSPVHDFVLLAAFFYLLARLLQMLPYKIPAVHPMTANLTEREKALTEEAATTEAAVIEEDATGESTEEESATLPTEDTAEEQTDAEKQSSAKKPRKKKSAPADSAPAAEEA